MTEEQHFAALHILLKKGVLDVMQVQNEKAKS